MVTNNTLNTTKLVLYLPLDMVHEFYRRCYEEEYIDLDEYVTIKLEDYLTMVDFNEDAGIYSYNDYGKNTLPFEVSIPKTLAFKLGLLSQRIQCPTSLIAKWALEDIYLCGCIVYEDKYDVHYIEVL